MLTYDNDVIFQTGSCTSQGPISKVDTIDVRLIESVAPIEGVDMKEHMEDREKFWQGTLKAAKLFGGLNKRQYSVVSIDQTFHTSQPT